MKKRCLYCGNLYMKKTTCSLKDWSNQKYCSPVCRNKSLIGKPSKSKTKYIKGDKRLIGNKTNIGRVPWNKGKSTSEETKQKISQSLLGRPTGRTGAKCNFWKGGKTGEYRKLKNSIRWRNWRRKVFERDNYTCQDCGIRNGKGIGRTIQLHPHHLKLQSKYPNLRFNVDNGITLCKDCHSIRHSNNGLNKLLVN